MKHSDGKDLITQENNCSSSTGYDELKRQLDKKSLYIEDEQDVEEIRRIVNEIDKISPIEVQSSPEEFWQRLEVEVLPEAYKKYNKKKLIKQNVRRLTRIASVIILVIALANINAVFVIGQNIFSFILQWSEHSFGRTQQSIASEFTADDLTGLSIDELLIFCQESGLYLPDTSLYVPHDVYIHSLAKATAFHLVYNYGGNNIIYMVTLYPNQDDLYDNKIEKSREDVEVNYFGEEEVYIISNNSWYAAVWYTGQVDYTLTGFLNLDDLNSFLDITIK